MACHVRGKRNLSYLASYPDFYTTHSWGLLLFFIDPQPDFRWLTTLCEAYIPDYRISMSEEQTDGFKSLR